MSATESDLRTPEDTLEITSTFDTALTEYPNLRLGQLIFVSITASQNSKTAEEALGYLNNFHSRLFNITDEELLNLLKAYIERKPKS